MGNNNLIVIGGPTASGKTAVSIEIAKRINGEIISADSVQVYKYMDIGSAKVTLEEMQGVKHYLIDELEPNQEFNIAVYKQKANDYIKKIYSEGKTPIIVGGTGFYVQSVIKDVEFAETETDILFRSKLENEAKAFGNKYLHAKLNEVDPVSAKQIHPNNLKRIIRALEYYKLTGEKISEHNAKEKQKLDKYNVKYFILNMDRDILYERINRRVDNMLQNGLLDEVVKLLEMGYTKSLTSMQAIGYKEIIEYIENKISLEDAIDKIKQNTRNFAKRQLTWYKHQVKDGIWIDVDKLGFDTGKIVEKIMKHL